MGNPILEDREVEHSPKQVHLALKRKPFSSNSLNLPSTYLWHLSLSFFQISVEKISIISSSPQTPTYIFQCSFPKYLLSKMLIPSHNTECGCGWSRRERTTKAFQTVCQSSIFPCFLSYTFWVSESNTLGQPHLFPCPPQLLKHQPRLNVGPCFFQHGDWTFNIGYLSTRNVLLGEYTSLHLKWHFIILTIL